MKGNPKEAAIFEKNSFQRYGASHKKPILTQKVLHNFLFFFLLKKKLALLLSFIIKSRKESLETRDYMQNKTLVKKQRIPKKKKEVLSSYYSTILNYKRSNHLREKLLSKVRPGS